MQTRWLYILIGNNNSGKTTLQKKIIRLLCGIDYTKLPTNEIFPVNHMDASRRLETLFTANRSFQEKRSEYKTIKEYFLKHFVEASAAIISSHSHSARDEIEEMIQEGKRRFYNVAGVFLSNTIDDEIRELSATLNWDERIYLENPMAHTPEEIEKSISACSIFLTEVIVGKYSRR